MTASDFLKIQADLLIALELVRKLPLAEFIAQCSAISPEEPLRDRQGQPVRTQPVEMAALASAAQQMAACGLHGVRKAAGREAGAGLGEREGAA
jgi:hypothetical protein